MLTSAPYHAVSIASDRQKYVSRSGAKSYHRTALSDTETTNQKQKFPMKTYHSEGDEDGYGKESKYEKENGNYEDSKAGKEDRNGEERETDW
jgi:hypothetical protein